MDSKNQKEPTAGHLPPQASQPYAEEERQRKVPVIVRFGRIGQWFQILCFMNIPVFGFVYMFIMAVRRKTPPLKRSFAIAYLLYRILVLLLAVTILYVLYKLGLDFVDEMLKFVGTEE